MAPSTALVTYDSLKKDLFDRHDHLAGILPPALVANGTLTAERFVHLGLLHFAESRGLDKCNRQSLFKAIYRAAKEGMELGIDCYILPFEDRKKGLVEATYVRDYRGDVKLIERTGKVAKAFAEVVYEHDICEIDYGNPTKPLTHKPALRQRGTPLGAYGAIVLRTGIWHVHYMDAEDLKRVKQRAPGRNQDTWILHETEMWRKTSLKNTAKYCQLTPQVQEAMEEEDGTLERLWTPTPEQAQRNIVELFDRSEGRPQPEVHEADAQPVETPAGAPEAGDAAPDLDESY